MLTRRFRRRQYGAGMPCFGKLSFHVEKIQLCDDYGKPRRHNDHHDPVKELALGLFRHSNPGSILRWNERVLSLVLLPFALLTRPSSVLKGPGRSR